MNARKQGLSQELSSTIADISERTGQRIDSDSHRPNRAAAKVMPRPKDPLSGVWRSELEPMLRAEPRLKPMTLFEYLEDKYPGKYPRVLRTLQRRVSDWKALHGPSPEVMFTMRHEPGVMGLSDFTTLKGMQITIGGEPFEHLIYHYRLAYSGWQYAQVIQGGESFIGLSEGLQNALFASGGVPKEHRTDSLSAAYRNQGGRRSKQVTTLYDELCDHYRLEPTRNNKGVAHENGAIESPHGHLKNRIKQAIYLRDSADFENVRAYQTVIETAINGLNRQCVAKFEQEKAALSPLPQRRIADYEVLSARVSNRSTIDVRCILYSVPSRLIGRRLELHLYHDRLVGYFASQPVFELTRIRVTDKTKRRGRCIDYRHVIDGLRRKPRAFLYCQWQQDLLPTPHFRQLWERLKTQFERDDAARLMVEALYIAATQDQQSAVADYLQQSIKTQTLTLKRLQQQFSPVPTAALPSLNGSQHDLDSYDQLLSARHDSTHAPAGTEQPASTSISNGTLTESAQSLSKPQRVAQTTQTLAYAFPMGVYRNPGIAAAVVLCAISPRPLRDRSTASQRNAPQAGHHRSSAPRRKEFYHL